MFKTSSEAVAYVDRFLDLIEEVPDHVELVLCPPFTALAAAGERLRGQTRVQLGAQDMHWENQGAFTGAIAPRMLLELGVGAVVIGHSERRQYFGETDETVRLKTRAALEHGLQPIVAVGESLETRESGRAREYVIRQVRAAIEGLSREARERLVIAYEPIWAIGTGKNCDPAQAGAIMGAIRECLDGVTEIPVLYGGSVKAENIAEYTAQPEIDGGLVGGASLDPQTFAALAAAAA